MQKILSKFLIFFLVSLFVMLPFHALGITALSHFFLEAGMPAPVFLKMWKEVLILVIFVVIGILGFAKGDYMRKKKMDTDPVKVADLFAKLSLLVQRFIYFLKKLDSLDSVIIGFSLLALIVSILTFSENSLTNIIYGIKYTLFPLWIFFIFRRISPEVSEDFLRKFQKIFLYFSGFLIFLGLIFFVLAQDNAEFFVSLGYSSGDSFYSIFQPLSYCQKISFTDICRAQGVMSGPNQLGVYLIFLISCLGGSVLFQKKNIFFWILFCSGVLLLFFTFSRSAWIGGVFSGLFFLFSLSQEHISHKIKQKFLAGIILLPVFFVSIFSIFFPEISHKVVNRVSSSSQHYDLSLEAAKNVLENPLGQGLGTAGAASKYESEKGEKEVGIIPENWYLQVGIETGILGMIFWVLIIFLVIKKLVQKYQSVNVIQKKGNHKGTPLQNVGFLSLASAIFGISIMGMFLHSWESSAVAYTVWGLAGVLIRKK